MKDWRKEKEEMVDVPFNWTKQQIVSDVFIYLDGLKLSKPMTTRQTERRLIR